MKNVYFALLILAVLGCVTGAKPTSATAHRAPANVIDNQNVDRAKAFFAAFKNIKPGEMAMAYRPSNEQVFQDPMFGPLNSLETAVMWQIVLRGGTAQIQLQASEPVAIDANTVRVEWTAIYSTPVPGVPTPERFKVTNRVVSQLNFAQGLIANQVDDFDSCAWAKMAVPGTTDANCQQTFAKVSAGFRALLRQQVDCLNRTGKACPQQ